MVTCLSAPRSDPPLLLSPPSFSGFGTTCRGDPFGTELVGSFLYRFAKIQRVEARDDKRPPLVHRMHGSSNFVDHTVLSDSRLEPKHNKDTRDNKADDRDTKADARDVYSDPSIEFQFNKIDSDVKIDNRADGNEIRADRRGHHDYKGDTKFDKDNHPIVASSLGWKDNKEHRGKRYFEQPSDNADWRFPRPGLQGTDETLKGLTSMEDRNSRDAHDSAFDNKAESKGEDKFRDKDRKKKDEKHRDFGSREGERNDRRTGIQLGGSGVERREMQREERDAEKWDRERKDSLRDKEGNDREKDSAKKDPSMVMEKDNTIVEKLLSDGPVKNAEHENTTTETKVLKDDAWKGHDRDPKDKKREKDLDAGDRHEQRSKYNDKESDDNGTEGDTEKDKDVFGSVQRRRMVRPRGGGSQASQRDPRFRSRTRDGEGAQASEDNRYCYGNHACISTSNVISIGRAILVLGWLVVLGKLSRKALCRNDEQPVAVCTKLFILWLCKFWVLFCYLSLLFISGKSEVSAILYKAGECMQELLKSWKDFEATQEATNVESLQNGPTLEIRIPAEFVTSTNRQVSVHTKQTISVSVPLVISMLHVETEALSATLLYIIIFELPSDLNSLVLMHTGYCSPTSSPPPSAIQELHATVQVLPPQESYTSTLRNNVRSRAWGAGIGCSFRIERCCIVKARKGGGTIDLEPRLSHTSAVEPTLAPVAVERTMTTRAAASNALRQQRFVREVTIQYNLCNEPWLKYSISIVADKGLKKSLYTSARLKKGEVIYLETHFNRYELCFSGEKPRGIGSSSNASDAEPEKHQSSSHHSQNGSVEHELRDVFRWSRCKKAMPESAMRSTGIPLPADQLEVLQDNLEWEDVQWSQTGVWVAGKEYPLARVHFLSGN
ncbi:hypothetical protein ZEAMMB73_Zm00001d006789 [Zea mays]|uniref:Zinc finger CCCH domain-containing protein 13 n=1 Tax=Zea mays TaxID=4577 RepID=A0A1D6F0Q6_MAIZE|nr:hypothetical protein ZEAMMB73_Zm00001d006789 [Zea mays]